MADLMTLVELCGHAQTKADQRKLPSVITVKARVAGTTGEREVVANYSFEQARAVETRDFDPFKDNEKQPEGTAIRYLKEYLPGAVKMDEGYAVRVNPRKG